MSATESPDAVPTGRDPVEGRPGEQRAQHRRDGESKKAGPVASAGGISVADSGLDRAERALRKVGEKDTPVRNTLFDDRPAVDGHAEPRIAELDLRDGVNPATGRIERLAGFDDLTNSLTIEVDRQTVRKDADAEVTEPIGFALDSLLVEVPEDLPDLLDLDNELIDIELDVIDEPETNPYTTVPAPRPASVDAPDVRPRTGFAGSDVVDTTVKDEDEDTAHVDLEDTVEDVDGVADTLHGLDGADERDPVLAEPLDEEVPAAEVAPTRDESDVVDAPTESPEVVELDPVEVRREERNGVLDGEEAPQRRIPKWLVAAQLLCLLAIPLLVWIGYQALLEDDEGNEVVISIGQTDPGYVAAAPVTPVMYVVQVNQQQDFVGAAILSQPDTTHGLVTILPATTVIPDLEGRLRTLEEIYSEAQLQVNNPSTAALVVSVATAGFLDVGMVDGMEILNPNAWERVLAPLGDLEVDQIVSLDDGLGNSFPAGSSSLDTAEAAHYVSVIDPDETAVESLQRQQDFWETWLAQLQEGGIEAVAGETGSGFGSFLAHFAENEVRVERLPGEFEEVAEVDVDTTAEEDEEEVGEDEVGEDEVGEDETGEDEAEEPAPAAPRAQYLPDADLPGWLAAATPFPQSESRVPVRLLNGTTDINRHVALIPQLIAAGSQIDLLGNAVEQNVSRTRIEYYSPETEAQATSLADVLGIGEVALVELEGESVKITIVVGDDAPPVS